MAGISPIQSVSTPSATNNATAPAQQASQNNFEAVLQGTHKGHGGHRHGGGHAKLAAASSTDAVTALSPASQTASSSTTTNLFA